MKQKIYFSYFWIIPLSLMWPIINLFIFALRFRKLPLDMFSESIVFIPMGIISSLVLIYLMRITRQDKKKLKKIVLGYIIACPFALFFSIGGGLLGALGSIIFGTIPLILGTYLGFKMK